jgi:phosphoglycolate phosphatase
VTDGRPVAGPLEYPGGPRYRHVCFDLDGTLVDSRADLADAMNHVLRELGRARLPEELLWSFVGEGARRLVERAMGDGPPALVDDALGRFMERYGAHLLDRTVPYPGVVDVLERLRAGGIVLSVLSNKPEAMSRAILAGLEIDALFMAVLGGDSLPTRKPDPAGVAWLLAAGGTRRAELLVVGDSGIDVRTARAAAVDVCGVSWGLSPEGMCAAGPDRVIETAAELLTVVAGCGQALGAASSAAYSVR